MFLRWLLLACLLVTAVSAAVRYDMTKEELLQELGKPTSILTKSGREVLIYPNNVRIELEHGKVVSVKGLDLAAAEAKSAEAATAAAAEKPATPAKASDAAGEDEEEKAERKLTPEERKARAEAEEKMEKEFAESNAKGRAEMEKAIGDLENLGKQPEKITPAFSLTGFLIELAVKWAMMLAALKLTCKYWNADVEWSGLMIAAAVDTAVKGVIGFVGHVVLGMFTVLYADEAIAAIFLVIVLRKVSTNQSLQQAITITLTSKTFSIVVGSFLSVMILRALN